MRHRLKKTHDTKSRGVTRTERAVFRKGLQAQFNQIADEMPAFLASHDRVERQLATILRTRERDLRYFDNLLTREQRARRAHYFELLFRKPGNKEVWRKLMRLLTDLMTFWNGIGGVRRASRIFTQLGALARRKYAIDSMEVAIRNLNTETQKSIRRKSLSLVRRMLHEHRKGWSDEQLNRHVRWILSRIRHRDINIGPAGSRQGHRGAGSETHLSNVP